MNSFTYYGQFMKFTLPEPDPKNVCNLCGGNVGKDNLIQGQAVNICFDCSDLAKEIADKERERLSKREIKRIAAIISDDEIDMGMAKAYPYAERLYKAGYRKVE
ncbi:TPA: hypothetical protein SMU09_000784 [Proteus mirabilis]|nr:hypothetical protein [Proteus mirabilis]HEK1958961.1 hypothetical protein [Proteus mirabilis]HEK2984418.1 hypothetical protein [Proteus mirabilis]HEK3024306.1 hypothetical protein [Proteus mirabilis]HEK3179767.1 hypothetical protein [Proteus mirabilis]